ncbi:MAG TPA: helix-turn-helix transcriptional regulator [Gemmata sp.]|jgi:transcriptional regulator with XRE-family HTH domain|nr:helix-turn-helix transcriptional regulator [Gemmata sp.]
MAFKDNLKRVREKKGWSQARAAYEVGIPFRSYQNWEAGTREPRLDALKLLANGFGVGADVLLEGMGKEPELIKPKSRRVKLKLKK